MNQSDDDLQPIELFYDLSALGLQLKPMKMPAARLVIDHIEKPAAN